MGRFDVGIILVSVFFIVAISIFGYQIALLQVRTVALEKAMVPILDNQSAITESQIKIATAVKDMAMSSEREYTLTGCATVGVMGGCDNG